MSGDSHTRFANMSIERSNGRNGKWTFSPHFPALTHWCKHHIFVTKWLLKVLTLSFWLSVCNVMYEMKLTVQFFRQGGGGGHDHHFEREVEEDVLEVEAVETYPVKNAETHRTEKYELAQQQESLVLRRSSAKFYLGIKSRKRSADFNKDDLRIIFSFGN